MLEPLSRRKLLRRGFFTTLVFTGAGTFLSACGAGQQRTAAMPAATPTSMPLLPPPRASSAFVPDLELRLRAAERSVQLLPGTPTKVWSYQAELLKGDPGSLQTLPDSYLGPIIRVRSGQKVRVHFENALPETDQLSIVHWHGLRLPSNQDAHPRYAIPPGQTYVYEFTVKDRAGTYWYHPHPHGQTGRQVYNGLAGLLLISDDEEAAAGLPSGAQDLPLVIQDRTFDADNQLLYLTGAGQALLMEQLMGFLGQRVLVNGRPDYTLDLATRAYRLRVLNASNSRVYKLGWEDGTPLTVIGSDGGLLERPLQRDYVMLGPGERVELWADFRDRPVGTELLLRSLAFTGAEGTESGGSSDAAGGHSGHGEQQGGGSHGGHGGHGEQQSSGSHDGNGSENSAAAGPPIGTPQDILRLRIASSEPETLALTPQLATITRYQLQDAANSASPRTLTLSQQDLLWRINGRSYTMGAVAPEDWVRRDTLELWELVNALNPDEPFHKQGMVHSFHIHAVQFQVLERTVLPELAAGWETVRNGYIDAGWKDTVLMMPGERVKLLLRFSDVSGTYMVHCHMLEHEDLGMMRDFEVVD